MLVFPKPSPNSSRTDRPGVRLRQHDGLPLADLGNPSLPGHLAEPEKSRHELPLKNSHTPWRAKSLGFMRFPIKPRDARGRRATDSTIQPLKAEGIPQGYPPMRGEWVGTTSKSCCWKEGDTPKDEGPMARDTHVHMRGQLEERGRHTYPASGVPASSAPAPHH